MTLPTQVLPSQLPPNAWGFQTVQTWEPGDSRRKTLLTLEQCVSAIPEPLPTGGAWPNGAWRIVVVADSVNVGAYLDIEWSTGNDSRRLRDVLTPFVACVPGFARISARPTGVVAGGPLNVLATVTQDSSSDHNRVHTVHSDVGALPQSTVRITALSAATYTPFGALVAIPLAAGATADVAGRVNLVTGSVVAWHAI